ncbi:uncharacterized protein LOC113798849 [Dermatophagoides pteronyssinus]|uniref:uncharacterized protein LOC113798849 n=1 Tax=Dermatophagoides pteronyssinus TaxID=6956 RepID=UPI003F676F2D
MSIEHKKFIVRLIIPTIFVIIVHLSSITDGTIIDNCKLDNDKNLTEQRYTRLQSIELKYLQAKSEAQKLIDDNREKGLQDDNLINRYDDLLRNYEQYDYMMKNDPEMCDTFIDELENIVQYFIDKVLKPRRQSRWNSKWEKFLGN